MARARNIKPSIMDNEDLAKLDPFARLLFIYMWMLADREGRLEDRPARIGKQALGYDPIDCGKLLQDLHDAGFIVRYEASGNALIQIVNFTKHQTPHVREQDSALPSMEQGTTLAVTKHNLDSGVSSPRLPDSLIPDSLIPDSLIPDSLIPDSSSSPSGDSHVVALPQKSQIPYEQIVCLYHQHCTAMPQCIKLSEKRRRQIASLWKEDLPSIEQWETFFIKAGQSDFLSGKANGFRADIEWLTNKTNALKVAEGRYDNRSTEFDWSKLQ